MDMPDFEPIKPEIQRLMVFMFYNNGVTFKDQTIYDSEKFYKAMAFLKHNGYVRAVCSICNAELKDSDSGMCKRAFDWRDKEHKNGNRLVRKYALRLKGEVIVYIIRENK